MGIDLTDVLVQPVEGKEDLFKFRFDFGVAPEGKSADNLSIDADSVTELDNGDLRIAGYAAVFDGLDRQNENFVEGAFERGIKSFLNGQAALCFNHEFDKGIGHVEKLEEHEGKGLYMEARVDHQPETSPLRYIYNAVKKGTYKGLSVGGFFKRKLLPAGFRIADMDFTDVSVCPVAVHPGTKFSVIAGKALRDIDIPAKPEVEEDEIRQSDEERLIWAIGELRSVFADLQKRGQGQAPASDSLI